MGQLDDFSLVDTVNLGFLASILGLLYEAGDEDDIDLKTIFFSIVILVSSEVNKATVDTINNTKSDIKVVPAETNGAELSDSSSSELTDYESGFSHDTSNSDSKSDEVSAKESTDRRSENGDRPCFTDTSNNNEADVKLTPKSAKTKSEVSISFADGISFSQSHYTAEEYRRGGISVSKEIFRNAGVPADAEISSETWPAEAFLNKKGEVEYLNVTKILNSPFAAQVRAKMRELGIDETKCDKLTLYKFIARHMDLDGNTTVDKADLSEVIKNADSDFKIELSDPETGEIEVLDHKSKKK